MVRRAGLPGDDDPHLLYRADLGDGGGGGGAVHRTESVAPKERPSTGGQSEAPESPPTEPSEGSETNAAKEAAMTTKPAPSSPRSKELKTAALGRLRTELDAITADATWPLRLIAADVPGSRDLLSVAVGLDPEPDDRAKPDATAPWGLVSRAVELRKADLQPLATITYTGALDADATMRLVTSGPDAVSPHLKRLARALRSAQLHDALTELGVIPKQAKGLDPSELNLAHRRLTSSSPGPLTLVLLAPPTHSTIQWAARARVTTSDASDLGLHIATDRGKVRALLLSTESIELLRYLGHDLECAETWKDADDGLTIEVTERRLLHRTCEPDRLVGIALA